MMVAGVYLVKLRRQVLQGVLPAIQGTSDPLQDIIAPLHLGLAQLPQRQPLCVNVKFLYSNTHAHTHQARISANSSSRQHFSRSLCKPLQQR